MKQGSHVLIADPDGNLILQQRDYGPNTANPGTISTWGGGVEPGEEPIDAVIREVHEELGLTIRPSDVTFWREFKKTLKIHHTELTVYMFVLKEKIDPKTLTVYEGSGYCIVKPDDDLDMFNLSQLAKEFVRAYFDEFSDRQPTSLSPSRWLRRFLSRPKS